MLPSWWLTGELRIGPSMMLYICETRKSTDNKCIHARRCRQEGLGSSSSLTEQPRRQKGKAVMWFTLEAPTRTQKIGNKGITSIDRRISSTKEEGDKDPMNRGSRRCTVINGPHTIATWADSDKLRNSIPTGPWPEKTNYFASNHSHNESTYQGLLKLHWMHSFCIECALNLHWNCI